jgi:hypothetical protein
MEDEEKTKAESVKSKIIFTPEIMVLQKNHTA